jgi:hypothetical protein
MIDTQYFVERRGDGAIVVRVPSRRVNHLPALPDAVFCFQNGDPQYDFWLRKMGANPKPNQAVAVPMTSEK